PSLPDDGRAGRGAARLDPAAGRPDAGAPLLSARGAAAAAARELRALRGQRGGAASADGVARVQPGARRQHARSGSACGGAARARGARLARARARGEGRRDLGAGLAPDLALARRDLGPRDGGGRARRELGHRDPRRRARRRPDRAQDQAEVPTQEEEHASMSTATIVLQLATLGWGVLCGAMIYEHVAVIPQWARRPPESLTMWTGDHR